MWSQFRMSLRLQPQLTTMLGSHTDFLGGTLGVLLVRTMGYGLLFASQVFLARILGVHQFGIYAYAFSWVTVIVLLAKSGMDVAVLRFAAAYKAQAEWAALRGILRRSRQIVVLVSICVSCIGLWVTLGLGHGRDQELAATFIVGWLLLPFLALNWLVEATLRALGHPVLGQSLTQIVRPVLWPGSTGSDRMRSTRGVS